MDGMYGKGLVKGLGVTLRHFIDTYLEDIRWLGKRRYYSAEGVANRQSTEVRGIFTVQYPEEKLPVPEEFRFIPFLLYEVDENGDKTTAALRADLRQSLPSAGVSGSCAPMTKTGRPIPEPEEFSSMWTSA
jgi:NADH-quinone oxidoreductase subunit I